MGPEQSQAQPRAEGRPGIARRGDLLPTPGLTRVSVCWASTPGRLIATRAACRHLWQPQTCLPPPPRRGE